MRIVARTHQLPPRLAAGAYILQAGVAMTKYDEEAARRTHGQATTAYPFLGGLDPVTFTRLLARSEIAIGAALLVPFVPSLVAGLGLTALGGGLVGLYLRLPGMRREGSLLPSEQGVGIAKDVWLLGIGTGLVVEELLACCRRSQSH